VPAEARLEKDEREDATEREDAADETARGLAVPVGGRLDASERLPPMVGPPMVGPPPMVGGPPMVGPPPMEEGTIGTTRRVPLLGELLASRERLMELLVGRSTPTCSRRPTLSSDRSLTLELQAADESPQERRRLLLLLLLQALERLVRLEARDEGASDEAADRKDATDREEAADKNRRAARLAGVLCPAVASSAAAATARARAAKPSLVASTADGKALDPASRASRRASSASGASGCTVSA
jgi:hypothetical protein